MNIQSIQNARWEYKKAVARLMSNQFELISIKFGNPVSEVKVDKRVLKLEKDGRWGKRFTISEGETNLLTQNCLGFWKTDLETRIGNTIYSGKAQSTSCLRVIYTSKDNKQILSYRRNTWKWRTPAEFSVTPGAAPPDHILLLLVAGYFTLRKLEQDNYGAVATIVAVSG